MYYIHVSFVFLVDFFSVHLLCIYDALKDCQKGGAGDV